MPDRRTKAFLSATLVSILWGLSYIGSTRAMAGGLNTFSLVSVRFVTASAAMLIYALIRHESLKIQKKDLLLIVLSAVCGITLYYFCELNGLKNLSASVSALIIATVPLLSLLTGIILFKKKPKKRIWLGVALSLVGVYLVVFTGMGENSLVGFFFMMGAALSWIVYLELTNRLLKRYSSLCLTFWQSIVGLLTVLPFSAAEHVAWAAVPLDAWLWACIFLGLLCSALGYILNNYSIAVLTPQTNAFFLNLSPVATMIGSYFLLHETVTFAQGVGSVFILISLFLI